MAAPSLWCYNFKFFFFYVIKINLKFKFLQNTSKILSNQFSAFLERDFHQINFQLLLFFQNQKLKIILKILSNEP